MAHQRRWPDFWRPSFLAWIWPTCLRTHWANLCLTNCACCRDCFGCCTSDRRLAWRETFYSCSAGSMIWSRRFWASRTEFRQRSLRVYWGRAGQAPSGSDCSWPAWVCRAGPSQDWRCCCCCCGSCSVAFAAWARCARGAWCCCLCRLSWRSWCPFWGIPSESGPPCRCGSRWSIWWWEECRSWSRPRRRHILFLDSPRTRSGRWAATSTECPPARRTNSGTTRLRSACKCAAWTRPGCSGADASHRCSGRCLLPIINKYLLCSTARPSLLKQ